jgi:hypothetical protein
MKWPEGRLESAWMPDVWWRSLPEGLPEAGNRPCRNNAFGSFWQPSLAPAGHHRVIKEPGLTRPHTAVLPSFLSAPALLPIATDRGIRRPSADMLALSTVQTLRPSPCGAAPPCKRPQQHLLIAVKSSRKAMAPPPRAATGSPPMTPPEAAALGALADASPAFAAMLATQQAIADMAVEALGLSPAASSTAPAGLFACASADGASAAAVRAFHGDGVHWLSSSALANRAAGVGTTRWEPAGRAGQRKALHRRSAGSSAHAQRPVALLLPPTHQQSPGGAGWVGTALQPGCGPGRKSPITPALPCPASTPLPRPHLAGCWPTRRPTAMRRTWCWSRRCLGTGCGGAVALGVLLGGNLLFGDWERRVF